MESGALEDQWTSTQVGCMMYDDSTIPNHEVVVKMIPGIEAIVVEQADNHPLGAAMATREAESLNFSGDKAIAREVEEGLGHGKCNARQTCFIPTASG